MAVVEVRSLSKSYGQTLALRDVSLEFGPGVTGLLGPNGAGKSTLLLCVLGLLPDWRGDVRVLGLDARKNQRALRRGVGFMPETDAYIPDMTAIRAVRYLGQLSGMSRDEALRRAHEMLFHVGLGEAVYRDLAEYSSGMRQRFKLAQALVHDPDVVFLDEPLAGMDPEGRDELLALVHDLATEHGKHVIWSSHILPEVQKVADSVVVLHQGRFRGTFRLEDLQPRRGCLTIEVEGEGTDLRSRIEGAGGEVTDIGSADGHAGGPARGRHVWRAALPETASATDVLRWSHQTGVRVRRVAPVVQDLEEVFTRLLDDEEAI